MLVCFGGGGSGRGWLCWLPACLPGFSWVGGWVAVRAAAAAAAAAGGIDGRVAGGEGRGTFPAAAEREMVSLGWQGRGWLCVCWLPAWLGFVEGWLGGWVARVPPLLLLLPLELTEVWWVA